jgi:hypothetical protein
MDVIQNALLTSNVGLSLLGYIDPGTGSMIFQVLAATLISAGLFFKGARERVMMAFYSIFRPRNTVAKDQAEPAADAADTSAPITTRKAA